MRHMGIDRSLLNRLVHMPDETWKIVVPNARDQAQAIRIIEAIPTPVYVGCDCPKEPDGSCGGEPRDLGPVL